MRKNTVKIRSIYEGNLILVNAQCPYRETLSSRFLTPVGNVLLEGRAAALLHMLMKDIGGWQQITAVSGWRSQQEQQRIWDESLAENGADFTEKYVAIPGHSEHQTGLAIDLGIRKEELDFIRPVFPYSGICQNFREKAARYGFIERYPAGKEAVTGIAQEPWHFRYVGMPHAEIMAKQGLTLEEYHGFLKQFPYGGEPYEFQKGAERIEIFFVSSDMGEKTLSKAMGESPCTLSGNNMDGYIVTRWEGRGD